MSFYGEKGFQVSLRRVHRRVSIGLEALGKRGVAVSSDANITMYALLR